MTAAERVLWSSTALLAATVVLFEVYPLDLHLQQLLFDSNTLRWVGTRTEPWGEMILYKGVRAMIAGYGAGLIITLVAGLRYAGIRRHRIPAAYALLVLIVLPGSVGLLKNLTNQACPKDLVNFGGKAPYTRLFEHYPETGAHQQHRCFPAGHASGGFALLAATAFFTRRRTRYIVATCAFSLAWAAGCYKMAIGHHFLSHTLVSMWLAIIVIAVLTLAFRAQGIDLYPLTETRTNTPVRR